jgi:predicted Zn-dependent peptidase
MKFLPTIFFSAVAAVGFSTANVSAQVYSQSIPNFEQRRIASTNGQTLASSADGIPDRPEKLSFAPLKYEPPVADNFRVQLKAGPVAYLVPDRERPLVNITLYVRTGSYLEPAGKEGLAELCGWLLSHGGAGTNSADQLEERLAFLAANLGTSIGDTEGTVSLNLLSKDLDEGLGILRDVLYAPKFQDDKITLRQSQMLQEMQQRNDDSSSIEGRETGFLSRGEKFFENHYSTSNSLANITHSDLVKFHFNYFQPKNFVVGVSGDFDREEMIAKLEKLFAGGPTPSMELNGIDKTIPNAIPTNFVFAASGVYLVNKPEADQGRVTMMLPAIMRDNPDYYACLVMNYILGGGGFSSRLMGRVRSDEGLAYDVHSRFPGGVYYPGIFSIGFQSKSRTVAYAAALCLEELKKISAEPVSDKEMAIAKNAFINTFPQKFATKSAVADIFAGEEFTGRHASDPAFWKNFRDHIRAVTKEDVQRVAKKYLAPENLVVCVVGNKGDILLGHPDHPAKLPELLGGKFTELPLRDPLTMLPVK